MLETFDQNALTVTSIDSVEKMAMLNSGFDSKVVSIDGVYQGIDVANITTKISNWTGLESSALENVSVTGIIDITKQMYSGISITDRQTLGLKEISTWKLDQGSSYYYQNLRQQSGYCAEVISTAKDNLIAQLKETGIKTYRADDLPDLYERNDQYVDKVRFHPDGTIEKIQVKFIGKNATDCLEKLQTSKYDKYFEPGKIDKLEIPKDFYEEIKENHLIETERAKLETQLEKTTADGNTEAAARIEQKIERLDQINEKLESSSVTLDEAEYARLHPQRYAAKNFILETVKAGEQAGLQTGLTAAALTACVSTVDNIQKYMTGEISAQEAVIDVVKDTGVSGAIGFGTGFITGAVSSALSQSSHQMLRSLGHSSIPGAVVSFAVESYDSVVDYATGEISESELAYDLGGNAVGIAGSVAGAAAAGAVLGSVVPGAGTVAGFAAGMVGGMVGYAVSSGMYEGAVDLGVDIYHEGTEAITDRVDAVKETTEATIHTLGTAASELGQAGADAVSNAYEKAVEPTADKVEQYATSLASSVVAFAVTGEAYATAVEMGSEVENAAEVLAGKAQELAANTIELAKDCIPSQVETLKSSMNNFAAKAGLPFSL